MAETDSKPKPDFDQVMLAMDVVDTLRHQQDLVDRELSAEEADRALIDKVKRMYASQGIEVTDDTISEAVAALRENRFAYQPPPPKGSLWLARLYVNRGFWARMLGALAAIALAAILVYQVAYVGPERRSRVKAAQDLNTLIGQQQDQASVAKERLAQLTAGLNQATSRTTQAGALAGQRLAGEVEQQLMGVTTNLRAFGEMPLSPTLDADSLVKEGDAVRRRLEQRANLLKEAGGRLAKAEAALTGLSELAVLPQKLLSLRTNLLAESREDDVRSQTEGLYNDAVAALNQGDVQGARKAAAALAQLQAQVVREYELLIVSRPGTPSGVWREPPKRPGTRNYYVIVEAVTPKGERLTLPITSEEDGSTKEVRQWGVRVDGATFDAVRRDKLDDGIIQNKRFGLKQRGYLKPHYLMPTTGGAITRW